MTRKTAREVRAVVRRWPETRLFEWVERAAIIEEATGCTTVESEVMVFEQMTTPVKKQEELPIDLSGSR